IMQISLGLSLRHDSSKTVSGNPGAVQRELGAALPEDDVIQPEIIEVPSGPKEWCAFNGDAALKAFAVAKL
ncbi:hypothetical protein J8I87_43315, partial [Paraburkholderia sp. LEh10]|nr:hypothetical protein [Paraburkholderia sp. LEh10]